MTNEELDAATKGWRTHPDPQHEETFADTERKLREIITTLRAQLAEARAERDVWEIDAKRNHQAAEIEFARADRAEAALAAQIEVDAKPALRLSIARKIGMYGSDYDGPFDARAYTYDHQPGNQAAWGIGRAASNAALDKVGDYIDRGLGLLRHLKAEGFGVFALNNNDTHDRTALDRMLAEAREKALREAAAVCLAVSVDPLTQAGREHAPWMKATAEDCSRAILAQIEAPNAR